MPASSGRRGCKAGIAAGRRDARPIETLMAIAPGMTRRMDALTMTSNPISSMTRLDALPDPDPAALGLGADSVLEGSGLAHLARLSAALASLEQLLSAGKAEEVPQVCLEVTLLAQELATVYSQSLIGSLVQYPEQRKAALRQIRRSHALCGALLRRWRRSLALRRQALDLYSESGTYAPTLVPLPGLK